MSIWSDTTVINRYLSIIETLYQQSGNDLGYKEDLERYKNEQVSRSDELIDLIGNYISGKKKLSITTVAAGQMQQ
ncbi:hypothetical protein P4H66_08040 [Paenibacillus dokdonensis]|uniref:Uncharacterized protein n=1 Tax=Paenibacillus dokdonensis TaxID=2567944 RepID=A0ABU6GJ81_9BACL|nr:hypothetical protein [Paenibacillus dokdonensis]MEC0239806.1 hypothetical protein [Paenibacillus dokdonensis]